MPEEQTDAAPVDTAVDDEAMFKEAASLAWGDAKEETTEEPEETAEEAPAENAGEYHDRGSDTQAALAAEREAREKAERDKKAADGRVRALQAKLAEYEKQQRAGTQPQPIDTDRLAQAAEEYPEIAGPVMDVLKGIKGTVEQMTAADAQRRDMDALREEIRLEQAEPGWAEFINQRADAFREWVEDQPRRIRDAAYRNANRVVNADEAASVIRAFREAQTQPTDTMAARRQRQLSATASPRTTRPASSVIPEEGDPDRMWAAMSKIAWRD